MKASKKSGSYLKVREPQHIRGTSHMARIKTSEKKTLLIKRFLINSASLIRWEFIPHQFFTMSAENTAWARRELLHTAAAQACSQRKHPMTLHD